MKKIKILILIGLLFGVFWFGYLNLRPIRIYREDFMGLRSPMVGPYDAAKQEVAAINLPEFGKKVVVMEKDKLYFDVPLKDTFTSAVFKVKFRNDNQEELNLRVPVHQGVEDAVKYYLENKTLDFLKDSGDWISAQDESTLLLQKQQVTRMFTSVKEFIEHLPVSRDKRGMVAYMGDYTFPLQADISKTQVIAVDQLAEDVDNFDYIVARYEPWSKKDNWKINQYEVVIPELFRKKNSTLPFYLESPNLEKEKNKIFIDSVEITLKKPRATVRKDRIQLK